MAEKIEATTTVVATPNETTVAVRVLNTFVDTVMEDTDLVTVGARLKTAIIDRNDLSEATLRTAMFGDSNT